MNLKRFFSIFFIALFSIVLIACGETTMGPVDWDNLETQLKENYEATLDNEEFVATEDLTLITEIGDATITWESGNTDYLGHDGTVTRPSFTEGDKTVTLTATLTIGEETYEVMFFVTIGKLAKTDAEIAAEVLASVMVFPFKEKWSSADSETLEFLTEGKDADDNVYAVTWTSSNPEIIAIDGTIVQPEGADVVVTMTATVTINSVDYSDTKNFTVAKMEEGTPVSTIAEAIAMGEDAYVKILGVTVIAKHDSGDVFFTDGVDILYIYTPTFQSEIGGVYDITGLIDIYYNAPQLAGTDTHPLRAEASTAPVSAMTYVEKAGILDIISEQTTPTPENLFSYSAYTVTAKVYFNEAWGNYSVFLVPVDYDFEAALATGATQPNGDSIMIYYKSDMDVLEALHGQEITLDIILQGWRSDKSVWYANFFGTADDITLSFTDDTEAVNAVIDSLSFPYSIIEDETLELISSLYGATITFTSTNNAIIDPTTGVVTATGLTEQNSVTLTASVTRGEITETKDFIIKVGPLPMSDVADAYTTLKGDLVKVTGIITTSTKAYQYFFQDGTAGIALDVYDLQTEFGAITLGSEIIITGQVDISNGLYELVVIDYEVQATTPALPTPADINAVEFTDVALLPYQGQLVSFSGFVLQETPEVDSYGTYKFTLIDIVNDREIFVMMDNRSVGYADAKTELLTLVPGDEVVITGAVLGWYYGYQLLITEASQFEKGVNGLTDQQKLDIDVETDIPATIVLSEDAEIPTGLYGTTYEITKVIGNIENYLDLTTTAGSILVSIPTGYDVTGQFEIEVTNGSVTEIILVDVVIDSTPITAVATDLFISEYGEGGSGNNKWIEIFNGTGEDVDLTGYVVKLASNGGEWGNTETLTGTLANGEVLVIYNSGSYSEILAVGDISSTITYFNGNDAVGLFKDGVLIDLIGVYGEDPGSTGWVVGDGSTTDHTLVRKDTILSPNATFTAEEWVVFPDLTFTEAGEHSLAVLELTDALKVEADKAELDLGGFVVSDMVITLPTTGSMGSTITWTIKTDAGSNATLDGNVLTLNAVEVDATVVIEATITLGETTPVTDTSVFTYYLVGQTAAERVAADKAELIALGLDEDLYIGTEITLPTTGSNGSTITWAETTDVDNMVTVTGNVATFLNATTAESTVVLTATITYGTESDTTTVTYTLKAYPIVDLDQFTTLADGDIVVVTGFVYAVIDSGFFVQDATGRVFVDTYGSTATYNVGDEVFLTGEVDIYNGFYKLAYLLEAPAALSTGNDVTQTPIDYVLGTTTLEFGLTYTIQGTVAIEGTYNNVYIYLNETDKIEIYYQSPDASIDALEALVGSEIFVDVIYYDTTRFAYVGGTEGYSEILTDFSALYTKTDGINFDIAIGDYVYLNGIVAGISNDGVFIQDANGVGIFMYHPDGEATLNVGDEVVYYGAIAEYKSARQLGYGADQIDVRTTGNAIVYNTPTEDEMAAFTTEDAGSIYTYTGFVYQGFSSYGEMQFEYTLSDGTTKETLYINSSQVTKWLFFVDDMFTVGEVLPKVDFILYQFDFGNSYLDVITVEYTDTQAIQYDSEQLPATLELTSDFIIPAPLLGSTYTVTAVSTELDSFIDETTTPGTLLVTRPASGQPDAIGTITIQVTLGAETAIDVVIDVTILAIYDTSGETTYTQDFAFLTTSTTSYSTSLSVAAIDDPNGFPWELLGRQNVGSWMLGNAADGSYIQVTATGGIYSITFDVVRAFTNTNIRSGEVLVNGVSVGTFSVDVNSDVAQTITIENIRVTGNVIIKIVTTSPGSRGAYNVDNISWTTYNPAP